jgi:hypothetical protein
LRDHGQRLTPRDAVTREASIGIEGIERLVRRNAIAGLKARGATAIVVGGLSLGGNAAIAYARVIRRRAESSGFHRPTIRRTRSRAIQESPPASTGREV